MNPKLKLKDETIKDELIFRVQYIIDNLDQLDIDYASIGLDENLIEKVTVQDIIQNLSIEEINSLFIPIAKFNASLNVGFSTDILANEGWFISLSMPAASIVTLAKNHEKTKSIELDEALISWYEENIESLSCELYRSFPDREVILRKAIECHKRGDYDLSVPIFLIQADGISHDVFGSDLYRAKNKQLRVVKKLKHFNGGELGPFLLAPFYKIIPLIKYISKKEKTEHTLNRHLILHGVDLRYGNQKNSLKTFSLLCYLNDIKNRP